MATQRRTYVNGPGGEPGDLLLAISPAHPSAHGVLRLAVSVDGDRIAAAEPLVGQLHRGAEKLFEVRDYRQIAMLANRHDWLSAFAGELGAVLTVEALLGVQVPERADWLRTLFAEINRVLVGLAFLGHYPGLLDPGAAPLLRAERESLLAVMEQASGARMHFMLCRVGGLVTDVPAGWAERARAALTGVQRALPGLSGGVSRWQDRVRGLGVLGLADALGHGVSGPVAWASGYRADLRRDRPYCRYGELGVPFAGDAAPGGEGDAAARLGCLLATVEASLGLALECLDRLPGGPVGVRLPKVVRPPEGSVYRWTEAPLGLLGYYLVSRGGPTPWRLALRTPSFGNVSALGGMLAGTRLPDLPAVLGSMFFVVGDIDK